MTEKRNQVEEQLVEEYTEQFIEKLNYNGIKYNLMTGPTSLVQIDGKRYPVAAENIYVPSMESFIDYIRGRMDAKSTIGFAIYKVMDLANNSNVDKFSEDAPVYNIRCCFIET